MLNNQLQGLRSNQLQLLTQRLLSISEQVFPLLQPTTAAGSMAARPKTKVVGEA
jgi:hypothetical protein